MRKRDVAKYVLFCATKYIVNSIFHIIFVKFSVILNRGENVELTEDTAIKEIKQLQKEMDEDRYKLCYENVVGVMDANIRAIGKELSMECGREVIKSVSSRLKTPESIYQKLRRKQLPISLSNAKASSTDLIGMRIVVMFLDDVYHVAGLLKSLKGLRLIEEKDYIAMPKDNGYMSLHLIFEIETYHDMKMRTERMEVQIRTMAMDCWSALDHQMIYKKDLTGIANIQGELTRYSTEIAAMDKRMMDIRNLIEQKRG